MRDNKLNNIFSSWLFRKSVFYFIFFLGATTLQAQEICNNGIDDDNDGFIDCGDSECSSNSACQDAFVCTSTLYQVISNELKTLDVSTGNYVTVGAASANYNGAGFNVQDGYIYGIYKSNSTMYLWRINNQGQETSLGAIANYGGINYTGDFDENGRLYNYAKGINPKLYYIDVDASPLQSVEQNLTNLAGSDIGTAADLTFNPVTKKFYGMTGDKKIIIIDPIALTIDYFYDAGNQLSTTGGFGAAWSDIEGNSYFSNNNTGEIFRLSLDGSGNFVSLLYVTTGQPTNSNDGIGCFLSSPPFESNCSNGIDEDGDGLIDCDDPDCNSSSACITVSSVVNATSEVCREGVATFNILLTNQSNYPTTITVTDVLPNGFTYIGDTIDFDLSGTFDATQQPAYQSTGTLTWGNIDLGANETVRVAYDALVSNSQTIGNYTNNVDITGAIFSGSRSSTVTVIPGCITETFDCQPGFYQVYKKRGEPNVYGILNPDEGTYNQIALISHQANGLGFDIGNGLAYGAVGKEFISLDDKGNVKILGISFSKKVYVGDMDTLGNWYGKVGGNIVKIAVSGPSIVQTYSGKGMPGWDMAYNKNGKFYAVHNKTLYQFDPVLGTKSTLGALTGDDAPSGGYGAQWTGKDGYLYISHNSTGEIYRIDVDTRDARLVMTSTADLRYNDGFSCPTTLPVVYQYDYGDMSTYPIATSLAYAQDLLDDNTPNYKMVWLGPKVSEDASNPGNAAGNGDEFDDGVRYSTSFRPGGTSVLNLDLSTNMTDKEVFYGLWIDWNNDNTFDDFYTGSSAVTTSKTVSVNINVPSNFSAGKVAIRARVGETAFVNNHSAGELHLGEVEDYRFDASINNTTKEISCLRVNFACDALEDLTYIFNNAAEVDADGDGINNDEDPDPKDPNQQFPHYIPSAKTFGTLAYEDLWPQKGDYDFNDFVLNIRETVITNASNDIYRIKLDFKVLSMGGNYNNDFCIALPDPNGTMTYEVYTPDAVASVAEEDTDNQYKIIKINKLKDLLTDVPTTLINARSEDNYYTPVEFQVEIKLNGDYKYPGGYTPKFFIEGNGINGHEIHLPGTAP
ncbi:MAG: LruC domain-containing protein, partial [Bacteroidota bacterium]